MGAPETVARSASPLSEHMASLATSSLARQAAAFRQEHGLEGRTTRREPPPSVIFTPEEAKRQPAEAFAALGSRGIATVASGLDPDVADHAGLFEGPARDRDMLTVAENKLLNKQIKRLLLLLSPHFLVRAAQECVEALLYRYHVHRWEVDEVLACALPYHDSPIFTRLLQGLQLKGKPRWAWLQPLKEKPATLVRSMIAKYCAKDNSVLIFLGEALQETSRSHKANMPLATLFAAVWLDTLARVHSPSPDLIGAALPPVLALLQWPQLCHHFYAAVLVAGALCLKVELEASVQTQLIERAARHICGGSGRAVVGFFSLLSQLQHVNSLSDKALRRLASAGPDAIADALPVALDSGNLLATLTQACLQAGAAVVMGNPGADGPLRGLACGILRHGFIVDRYADPLSLAVLQIFHSACVTGPTLGGGGEQQRRVASLLQEPLTALGARQPVVLSSALKRAMVEALDRDASAEPWAELMAPTCVGFETESDGSILPIIEAFSSKCAKTRSKAVQKAVVHLEGSSDQKSDIKRQRVLITLILQAAQDDHLEVARKALQAESLWSYLPQADAHTTAQFFESMLAKLVPDTCPSGGDLRAMFASTLLENKRVHTLAPLLIRCLAMVSGRTDCAESVRQRIDSSLMPLLVLCFAGLDAIAAAGESWTDSERKASIEEFRSAVLEFCKVSKHTFFSKFKHNSGASLCSTAAESADSLVVQGLCNLLVARSWTVSPLSDSSSPGLSISKGTLGGSAVQVASCALLAQVLPFVSRDLGNDDPEETERLLIRCVDACEHFAWQQSRMRDGVCDGCEQLCMLSQALLGALSDIHARQGGKVHVKSGSTGGGSRRRSRTGSSGSRVALPMCTVRLLRVAVARPRTMGSVLRDGLGSHHDLLRPAILRLALQPDQPCTPQFGTPSSSSSSSPAASHGADASTANALLLMRSLFLSTRAPNWIPSQCIVVLLLARLASATVREVRSAALKVVEAIHPKCAELEAPGSSCWETPCALALRAAGVLKASQDVLSPSGWAVASEQKKSFAVMSEKSLALFLDQVLAHKIDIAQDSTAAISVLSKLLVGKAGAARTTRTKECAFWGVGIAMILQTTSSKEPPALMAAVPLAGLLEGMGEALWNTALATSENIRKSPGVAEAPGMLHIVARKAVELMAEDGSRSPERGGQDVPIAKIMDYLERVALPICSALVEVYEGGGEEVSDSVADLAGLLCRSISCACMCPLPDEMKATALATLLALCVAASACAPVDEVAIQTTKPTQRVFASARSAFLEAPLEAPVLRSLMVAKASKASAQQATMELVYQHVVFLDCARPGSGELLVELGKLTGRTMDSAGAGASLTETPLPQALMAISALSERLVGGNVLAESVDMVCDSLEGVCRGAGDRLTATMLSAIIRAAAALAPFAAQQAASESGQFVLPSPQRVCVEALRCFRGPLEAGALGVLRASLWRLSRHPDEAAAAIVGPQDLAMRDRRAQLRLRLLLHTLLVKNPGLVGEVDSELCLSFAGSVGPSFALDYIIVLFLVRWVQAGSAPRKPARKRRLATRTEDQALEVVSALLDDEEGAVDEAVGMLTSIPVEHRFRCLGTLAQTLCCLALELCPAWGVHGQSASIRKQGIFWGPALLPSSFVGDVGMDVASEVLRAGLAVARRFVAEHGLPSDLDEAEVDATQYRITTYEEDGQTAAKHAAAAALALCYVMKATCVIEVLVDSRATGNATLTANAPGTEKLAKGLADRCAGNARQLRELLARSLAVNHPRTFFHSVCCCLQVSGLSPAVESGDLLSDPNFSVTETLHVMVAASEALQSRWELHATDGGDAKVEVDSDAPAVCTLLCTAATRHICDHLLTGFLEGASTAEQDPRFAKVGSGTVMASPSPSAREVALHVQALRFLESLCRFSARVDPQAILETCVPAVSRSLVMASGGALGNNYTVVVASCMYLLTAVEQVGLGILDRLGTVLPAVLDVLEIGTAAASCETCPDELHAAALVEQAASRVLQALVKTAGRFLSPYLDRLLLLCFAPSHTERTRMLEILGRELATTVPHRLLLPAVVANARATVQRLADASGDATAVVMDECLVRMQRLATMLAWIFSTAPPDFASAHANAAADCIMRLLSAGPIAAGVFLKAGGLPEHLPSRVLRRDLQYRRPKTLVGSVELDWTEWCAEGSVLRLDSLCAVAFGQLALRLTLEELRPRFVEILDWARDLQTKALSQQGGRKGGADDILVDTSGACRVLAVLALMQGLSGEAPEISEELFLPLVLKDLVSCLDAAQRNAHKLAALHRPAVRKRQRTLGGPLLVGASGVRPREVLQGHTWWWFEVMIAVLEFAWQALRHAGGSASHTKVVDDSVEALVDPCAEVISVFEFLPPLEDSAVARSLLEAVQDALVSLVSASEGARTKRILTAVLSKSRSDDAELRLCSVKVCHKIWLDLGVQVVTALSEVLMFVVELLEDEDPRVEAAVRALVRSMEECTGESLQDHLKR